MRRTFVYVVVGILLFTYAYTVLLVRNNTRSIIEKDMQSVSGILYAANIVLLDVEQSIEEKYADMLYQAAIEIANSGKMNLSGLDVAFFVKNDRVHTLQGRRFVHAIKACIDTVNDLPVALNCGSFYVYAYSGGERVAVVGVLRKRVEDEKAEVGLDRFFNELSRVGLFFYVALEDMNKVAYSTVDERYLSLMKEDSTLLDVYVEGKEKTRIIEFLGKKVLETIMPFSYGSFRGIMRVGMDASEYITMEKRMLIEITVLYFVLLLTLIFAYMYLEKARKAQTGYRNIRKALEKASVPVVVKRGDKLITLSGKRSFEEAVKAGVHKDGEVFIEGRRYLVERIDTDDETYFLFISMEKEDMKRKIMEYEALGRLIGEVAHEIKNPLNGIALLVQTLDMEMPKNEYRDIMEQVKRIEESLNRFVALIAPLRLSKECISQREIIQEAMGVLGLFNNEKVKIVGDVRLLCDKSKMKEVYVNLLKNAREAQDKGDGKIDIEIQKNSIVFRNRGNIPKDVIDKIFEPFFTTKDKGSGVGLYYVKKIVESHGWRIGVRNVNGEVEVQIEFTEDSRC